jgi:hypothetical protein
MVAEHPVQKAQLVLLALLVLQAELDLMGPMVNRVLQGEMVKTDPLVWDTQEPQDTMARQVPRVPPVLLVLLVPRVPLVLLVSKD